MTKTLSIGAAVKSTRERLGKTQLEFAAMLGCRANTVSRWERDAVKPSGIALIELLNLSKGEERDLVVRALMRETGPDIGYISALVEESVSAKHARSQLADAIANPKVVALLREYFGGPPMSEILSLWEQHKGNQKALKHFRDAAAFLRVQLANMER
jgi:transcriptional regulator with XRE-family HTH domain